MKASLPYWGNAKRFVAHANINAPRAHATTFIRRGYAKKMVVSIKKISAERPEDVESGLHTTGSAGNGMAGSGHAVTPCSHNNASNTRSVRARVVTTCWQLKMRIGVSARTSTDVSVGRGGRAWIKEGARSASYVLHTLGRPGIEIAQ